MSASVCRTAADIWSGIRRQLVSTSFTKQSLNQVSVLNSCTHTEATCSLLKLSRQFLFSCRNPTTKVQCLCMKVR